MSGSKRYCAQLTYCSPQKFLRRTVLEYTNEKCISQLFAVEATNVEPANTLFLDGVISAGIVSLKMHLSAAEIKEKCVGYKYVDLTEAFDVIDWQNETEKYIFDAGTQDVSELNLLFRKILPALPAFSLNQFVAGFVYFPSVLLGNDSELTLYTKTDLVLWQNVDLPNKKTTPNLLLKRL